MVATRIVELAAQIQHNTIRLEQYFRESGLPSPSFEEDGPVDFKIEPEDVQKAYETALDSTLELHQLLAGPEQCLRPVLNGMSLQAIYKYDIASKVPTHGEISFMELSSRCGLDEINLRRILRFAIAFHHVFQEPRIGFVAHSAASRKLADDPLARAGLGFMFDEVWPSFAQTIKARAMFKSDEPNKSGWSLSQHTDKPLWEYYESHPEMAKRFAAAMSSFVSAVGLSVSFLVKGYPWSSIGGGTGKVVDVGGAKGNISVAIAQSAPGLNFVVQDLPNMIKAAEGSITNAVAGRIELMEHDFFTKQPVEGDLYLFRNVLHDWADSHVIEILRATRPALKQGARILINDYILPDPKTVSPSKEREFRSIDMVMLTLFNSREREQEGWRHLLEEADPRFTDIKIWVPEGSILALIEAVWSG